MINIVLAGAGGRMGQAILRLLPNFSQLNLAGAVEAAGHPQIGKNVYKNIGLTSNLSALLKDLVCHREPATKCGGRGDLTSPIVIVDFTNAETSTSSLKFAVSLKVPAVIGATGHNAEQRALIKSASQKIPIVFSPNMSVGVNVLWRLVEEASSILGKDYQVEIVETHHIHKKDAPSGTAKRMLDIIAEAGGYDLDKDVLFHTEHVGCPTSVGEDSPSPSPLPPGERVRGEGAKNKIRVKSIREGEVVGNHTITFTSPYESLEITHRAFSREVFAVGALRAAVWIVDKKAGLYEMKDVLGIR